MFLSIDRRWVRVGSVLDTFCSFLCDGDHWLVVEPLGFQWGDCRVSVRVGCARAGLELR